jgi:hypothetical protein
MPAMIEVDGARFGVQANVGGVGFTLDDDQLGKLDAGNMLGPIDGGWIDLACDVTDARWTVGASRDDGVFTRYEAGVAHVQVVNVHGHYTPDPTRPPYYDRLNIVTPMRLWAGAGAEPDRPVFTGTVEGLVARDYLDVPTVEYTLVDGVVDLNTYDPAPFPEPGVGVGESASARVHRILDEAAWSAPRVVPDGGPAMVGLTFEQSAWTELRAVLEAARWQVSIDGDGTLRVEPYPFDVQPELDATFGCGPGEAVAVDVELAHDITQLRNIVDAASDRDDAPTFTHRDDTSVARYGPRRSSHTLALQVDGDVDEWAAWVLANSTHPQPRIGALAVRGGLDPTGYTWQVVAAARLGDVWRVHYPDLHIDRTSWLRGWVHAVRADKEGATWETLAVLSTGSLGQQRPGPFTLDHDWYGLLDAGNRLQ